MSRIIALCMCLFFWLPASASEPLKMVIIITHDDVKTSNRDVIRSMGIVAHSMNIHAPREVAKYLNDHNAISQEDGERIIRERVQNLTEEEKISFFRPAYIIKKLGIKKLPVVIYDSGEEIVYGVTDFVQAVKIWEQTR